MFTIERIGLNRLDMQMSGKLDTEKMKAVLDEFADKSEGISDGAMLCDVVDFHIPSLGAIAVELSRLPSMFGLIRKFNRAAVLTDKNWIKRASELEGWLIPGLEIKAFDRDQKEEAEAWIR